MAFHFINLKMKCLNLNHLITLKFKSSTTILMVVSKKKKKTSLMARKVGGEIEHVKSFSKESPIMRS